MEPVLKTTCDKWPFLKYPIYNLKYITTPLYQDHLLQIPQFLYPLGCPCGLIPLYAHTHTNTHTHARTHARTHTHTHTHTHTYIHTCTCTHTCTYTHVHAHGNKSIVTSFFILQTWVGQLIPNPRSPYSPLQQRRYS